MIDPREDQAAGLRRLFRRSPPVVVAMYVTGKNRATTALETCYRIAGSDGRLLLLDECTGDMSPAHALGQTEGTDLLGILGETDLRELIMPMPGLIGRIPVAAAAMALPLLDEARRKRLVEALGFMHRRAGCVVVNAAADKASAPSPFVFASPRRLLVAEASRSGATEAYTVIKGLAASGAGSLHVAVARARNRQDAKAFFVSLERLVREHVGVPLAWVGEVECDDIGRGLERNAVSSPREPQAAFLRRLAALGNQVAR